MLVDCVTSNGQLKGNIYLYDIATDYKESTNLMKTNFANQHADMIQTMQACKSVLFIIICLIVFSPTGT